MLNKNLFSFILVITTILFFAGCTNSRKSGGGGSCLAGQTLVSGKCIVCQIDSNGNCVDTSSLCSSITPEALETDTRVPSWGGIAIYKMVSDSCYADALTCNFYQSDSCLLWKWSQQDKDDLTIGAAPLTITICDNSSDPNCDSTYIFRFVKCSGDVYLLSILGRNNIYKLTCDNKSGSNSVSSFKIGSTTDGIGISQINNQIFVLTPQKKTSIVMDISSAEWTSDGSWQGDVPSIQDHVADDLVTCLKSLTGSTSLEGTYCAVVNYRFTGSSAILM
ncbi:MAG: hypothetical protein NTY22_03785 [Proteobacteria bacterium]|nr:hypothetical protein [Pseudomonadota bacterium]